MKRLIISMIFLFGVTFLCLFDQSKPKTAIAIHLGGVAVGQFGDLQALNLPDGKTIPSVSNTGLNEGFSFEYKIGNRSQNAFVKGGKTNNLTPQNQQPPAPGNKVRVTLKTKDGNLEIINNFQFDPNLKRLNIERRFVNISKGSISISKIEEFVPRELFPSDLKVNNPKELLRRVWGKLAPGLRPSGWGLDCHCDPPPPPPGGFAFVPPFELPYPICLEDINGQTPGIIKIEKMDPKTPLVIGWPCKHETEPKKESVGSTKNGKYEVTTVTAIKVQ